MDRDRILELLSDWLLVREAARFGRATGLALAALPAPHETAALCERAEDLTDPEVARTLAEGPVTADPERARWLELLADAVADLGTADAREQVVRLRAEPVATAGSGPTPFEALEGWLVRQPGPAAAAASAGHVEAAAERVAAAETEYAEALLAVRVGDSVPEVADRREAARGRCAEVEHAWAREVVEAGLPLLPACQAVAAIPPWMELPLRLRYDELSPSVPEPDRGLASFVCERLGVGRLFDRRVRLELRGRPGRPARDLVVWLPGDGGVAGARQPLGRLRDYRGLLRLLGRSLSRAGIEGEGIAVFRADPGLEFVHGALLEGQLLRPAWLERVLGVPPPAAVRAGWWTQIAARTTRLAAEVVAARAAATASHPAVPAVPPRDQARELRVLCPAGVLPWSAPVGEAADELAGRLVAVALDDYLSRRWGSAWSLSPGAGGLLRDLWAAGHPTLGALCADLGLDEPSPAAALDLFRSGPP